MKHLLSLFLLLCITVAAYALPDNFSAKNPEIVNAKSVSFERYGDLLIIYRIQRGSDNIIEAYKAIDAQEQIELQPVGAFRENTVRDYRPLTAPPAAYITDPMGDKPKFVSPNATFQLDLTDPGNRIHYENKEMLKAYADFLEDPDSYQGISNSPIPNEAEQLKALYKEKLSKKAMSVRLAKKQAAESLNSQLRWIVISMLLPLGLLLWLMLTTANLGIAVKFHSKIRSIAPVEIFTILMGIACIYVFAKVNWPWIVVGVVAILVALWLFLCLSYRTYEHIRYALNGSFPWGTAISFGIVGMLFLYQAVASGVIYILDRSGVISVDDNLGIWQFIGGQMVALVLLCVTGFLYYRSLIKKAPQLGRSFIWISIATIVAAATVALLIVVVIAVLVFKGSGKAFMQSDTTNSGANNSGVGHDCSKCRNRSMGGCSIYPDFETPPFNCPHYDPY